VCVFLAASHDRAGNESHTTFSERGSRAILQCGKGAIRDFLLALINGGQKAAWVIMCRKDHLLRTNRHYGRGRNFLKHTHARLIRKSAALLSPEFQVKNSRA